MAHSKTFVPKPSPVTVVTGDDGLVIVPEPEINVHAPVPIEGVFAFIFAVGEEMQSV